MSEPSEGLLCPEKGQQVEATDQQSQDDSTQWWEVADGGSNLTVSETQTVEQVR